MTRRLLPAVLLLALATATAGPRPCEVAVERIPAPPPETTAGELTVGSYFLDPFGDVRQVVRPLGLPPEAPLGVLWGVKQPPIIAGQVYTVLVADGTLTLLPADTWARPVIDARVKVRIVE